MYDPSTARFLTKDPIEEKGGSPNLYLYCANDPVNHTDPSGMGDMPATAPLFFKALSEERDGKRVVTYDMWIKTFGNTPQTRRYWENLVGRDTSYFTEEWLNTLLTEEYRNSQRHDLKIVDAFYTGLLALESEVTWDKAKAVAEEKPFPTPPRSDTQAASRTQPSDRRLVPTGGAVRPVGLLADGFDIQVFNASGFYLFAEGAAESPLYLTDKEYKARVNRLFAQVEFFTELTSAGTRLTEDEYKAWLRESQGMINAINGRKLKVWNEIGRDKFIVGFTGDDGKEAILGTTSPEGKKEIEALIPELNRSPENVRGLAVVSGLGNVAQTAFGVMAAPEHPLLGGFMIIRGAEGAGADVATIASGKPHVRLSMIGVKEVSRVFVKESTAENIMIGTEIALSIADILTARKANLPTPGAPGASSGAAPHSNSRPLAADQ